MGKVKFYVSSIVVSVIITVTMADAVASARKGVQAFQRGKYDEALNFLKPAANDGDAEAMNALGQMYASGRGIEKDVKLATEYFRKAAELGNAEAQQNLGSALMLGDGIEQDMVEALKWFIISARAGNKAAASYTKKVGGFLSRDMQREARMKALEWQKARSQKPEARK